MTARILVGDALPWLQSLPESSVALIATDPPYNFDKADWDRWPTDAAYLAWLDTIAAEWARVLKPNGSIYCFASPQLAARVEVLLSARFNVLNSIVWRKCEGFHRKVEKEAARGYFPQTERIIFAEHFGADNSAKGEAGYVGACDKARGFIFEPLRAYLDGERIRAGVGARECNAALGNFMSGHYFTQSQWALPTATNYEKLRSLFNANGGEFLRRDYEFLRRDYEFLRRDYEDLRRDYEDLRRPFSVTAADPYTDVWDFATVPAYDGKHPCEKPLALCRHIVRSSSRPGDTVLDSFCGSGPILEAAIVEGRTPIGCDFDPHWVAVATARCERAVRDPSQVGRPLRAERADPTQMRLIE